MNLPEATELVAILQAHAPHHQTTEATFRAWHLAMDDVPAEAAMLAARIWMRHHKHFPYPSELREIIADRLLGLPDAADAWQLVLERIRNCYFASEAGPWDAPTPVLRAVEAVGGIHALRMSTTPGKDAQQFAEAYGRFRERALRELEIAPAWDAQLAAGDPAHLLTAGPTRS